MAERPHSGLPDDLDLPSICDGNVYKLIHSYAHAIGVPETYVFFPLLSCVSGLMGNSKVKVNDMWSESCALWCSVIGPKGSRKSTVIEALIGALPRRQQEEGTINLSVNEDLENFKAVVASSERSRNIVFHEDIPVLLSSVSSTPVDMLKIQKLYDFSSLSRSGPPGFAGFISTHDAVDVFKTIPEELTSRMLVAWPKEVHFKTHDMKVPIPANTPKLSDIFLVISKVQNKNYSLNDAEAKEKLNAYIDKLSKDIEENCNGAISYHLRKVCGQVIRLSAALLVLKEALKCVVYQEEVEQDKWKTSLRETEVESACAVLDHVIKMKSALLSETSDNIKELTEKSAHHGDRITPQRDTSKQGQRLASIVDGMKNNKRKQIPNDPPFANAPSTSQASPQEIFISPQSPSKLKRARHCSDSGSYPPLSPEGVTVQGYSSVSSALGTPIESSMGTIYVNSLSGGLTASSSNKHAPPAMHMAAMSPHAWSSGSNSLHSNVEDGEIIVDSSVMNALTSSNETVFPEPVPLGESQQFLGVFDWSDKANFIARHARRLKKLFELTTEHRITPSTCSQMHLIPPLTREQLFQYNTVTKYPVIVSKEYLYIVAQLGFGRYESVNISYKRISNYFEKFRYKDLSAECKDILRQLGVTEDAYMEVFKPRPQKSPFSTNINKNLMMMMATNRGMGNMGTPNYQYPSMSLSDRPPGQSSHGILDTVSEAERLGETQGMSNKSDIKSGWPENSFPEGGDHQPDIDIVKMEPLDVDAVELSD